MSIERRPRRKGKDGLTYAQRQERKWAAKAGQVKTFPLTEEALERIRLGSDEEVYELTNTSYGSTTQP